MYANPRGLARSARFQSAPRAAADMVNAWEGAFVTACKVGPLITVQ